MYLTINWFIKTGWRGMIVWDFGVQGKLVAWLPKKKKSPDRRLAVSNMY